MGIIKEKIYCCPICGSGKFSPWHSGMDRLYRLSDDIFTYSKCMDCDLIFLTERPIESEIGKFYPQDYAPHMGSVSGKVNKKNINKKQKLIARISRKLSVIAKFIFTNIAKDNFEKKYAENYMMPENSDVFLDYGCGSDKFLNKCRKAGWKTTIGIDFSNNAIDQVKNSGHQGYLVGEGAWGNVDDNSVDFIRMNHVVEHLYDPLATLRQAQKKLKIGGVLHVALPNPRGFSATIFGERWFSLETPRHIMHYSPEVLRKVLGMVGGFTVITELHESSSKDACRSLGYCMWDWGWITHESATIGMLERPVISRIFYVLLRVFASRGRGDRYHIFTKKTEQVDQ